MKILRFLDDALVRVQIALAVAFLGLILILTATQVFMRYVLGQPLMWTGEASRYSMVALTYVLAGALARGKDHIALDLFARIGSRRAQRVVDLIGATVVALAIGWLALASYYFIANMFALSSPSLGIPVGLLPLIVVTSLSLMVVQQYVAVFVDKPRSLRELDGIDVIDLEEGA